MSNVFLFYRKAYPKMMNMMKMFKKPSSQMNSLTSLVMRPEYGFAAVNIKTLKLRIKSVASIAKITKVIIE